MKKKITKWQGRPTFQIPFGYIFYVFRRQEECAENTQDAFPIQQTRIQHLVVSLEVRHLKKISTLIEELRRNRFSNGMICVDMLSQNTFTSLRSTTTTRNCWSRKGSVRTRTHQSQISLTKSMDTLFTAALEWNSFHVWLYHLC
jgi:hypothetical protein